MEFRDSGGLNYTVVGFVWLLWGCVVVGRLGVGVLCGGWVVGSPAGAGSAGGVAVSLSLSLSLAYDFP
eukprot:COSAG01_NODE_64346_length_277_cov_0.264045_1_plen_67_part_01